MTHDQHGGASLRLVGLSKHYDSQVAVDAIDLAIDPGEFVTLLGPSGSGKTTTLNMIAGFAEPTSGRIELDGVDISASPPHKRNIGVVFQNYLLFPHMSVWDNIAFPLKQRRTTSEEIRRSVGEALDLVGLGQLGQRMPRQLSGGQQQRVALARAIVFHPRLLLMDEPLGALDKNLRETMQLEIKRIHREVGITFVYVTHDQEEALVLSDRVAIFRDGHIEQVGSAEDLYERPQSLFVARFIGDSNYMTGTVIQDGDRLVLDAGQHRYELGQASHDVKAQCAALVIRPERLSVGEPSDHLPSRNHLDGVVRQVVYLGAFRMLEVVVPGARLLRVREQVGARSHAREGDSVQVWWLPDDGVVVPCDETAGADSGARIIG